jgi:hypothetical protein
VSSSSPSRNDLRDEAERLLKAGDSRRAESILHTVVDSTPEDTRAWQLLGTARYRNGQLVPAVDAYRRLLRLAPDDSVAHYSLAIALRDLGQVDEARQHLRRALQLRPDFVDARQRLNELEQPTAAKARSPDLASPSRPPRPATERGGFGRAAQIVGRARQIQRSTDNDPWLGRGTIHQLSFRVERADEAGNPLPPVPVEIRGARIAGTISEGDWVEAPGRWRSGGRVRATTIRNLTTNETIRVRNLRRLVMLGLVALFVVAFIFFALWGVNRIRSNDSDPGPPPVQTGVEPGPGPQPTEPEPTTPESEPTTPEPSTTT